jgi:S1 RNA binding domain protein
LSIKKAQPKPEAAMRPTGRSNGARRTARPNGSSFMPRQQTKEVPVTFEDKLKLFMQDSESRMADIRHNRDKKTGARRRK